MQSVSQNTVLRATA